MRRLHVVRNVELILEGMGERRRTHSLRRFCFVIREYNIAMPRFKIAHVKEQGIDLIIIPLDPSFGRKSPQDQRSVISELQGHAIAAGLAGTVVPVWEE